MAKSPVGAAGLHWLAKEITWDDRHHSGRVSATVANGVRLELAVYAFDSPVRSPFVVNLMMIAPSVERFADLVASFRP